MFLLSVYWKTSGSAVHCLPYRIIYLGSLTAFVSAKIPHHMELTQLPGCCNNECCTCRCGNWIL